ncbi:hypothetical protein GCM10009117_04190 [Gangjinia marincola]|uniref:DUF2911 domain-containing protein n=1 Tax=Gangjinia marincola TaxID=578463 RepID=A0ABN1MDV7_9FLAO
MNIRGIRVIVLITVVTILVMVGIFLFISGYNAISHSETTVTWKNGDTLVNTVFYKPHLEEDQIVFGEYLPYGKVWKTSDKEPAIFSTNKNLVVDGSYLKAGNYTLWSIPMKDSWKIMFNTKEYDLTEDFIEENAYDPDFDALVIQRPVTKNYAPLEELTMYFTSAFDQHILIIAWQETAVHIPFTFAE